MPIIYMKHPIHGAKVATIEMEAEYDERSGWERYTPGEEVEPAFLNQLPRRGRPRKEPEHVNDGG
jgi:hypothetical protein